MEIVKAVSDLSKILHNKGLGSGAIYESVDSNTTATVKQVDSKFVVSITTPVTLTRTLNDGLAQAPQNFALSSNEVR
jgi:hypothetical protein